MGIGATAQVSRARAELGYLRLQRLSLELAARPETLALRARLARLQARRRPSPPGTQLGNPN